MKRILVLLVAFFSLSCMGANLDQTVRVSVITESFPSMVTANVDVDVHLPMYGRIYAGVHPAGYSNSIVGKPLFVTENNEIALDFQLQHPCTHTKKHTLRVTNSCGFDEYLDVSSTCTYRAVVPLDPSGSTVISLILMY